MPNRVLMNWVAPWIASCSRLPVNRPGAMVCRKLDSPAMNGLSRKTWKKVSMA